MHFRAEMLYTYVERLVYCSSSERSESRINQIHAGVEVVEYGGPGGHARHAEGEQQSYGQQQRHDGRARVGQSKCGVRALYDRPTDLV